MLVIGNGESRQSINLNKCNITKIGCNAICRDYNVDYLICVDKRMVSEAITIGYSNNIYTRPEWIKHFPLHKNVISVPILPYLGTNRADEPFHWGSGPYAVLLGALKSKSKIYMLGFDLYSNNFYVNNIYKNTKNYDSSNKKAVDPRYWIYQIGKVFENFPFKQFVIYQESNWLVPDEWKQINVSIDLLDNFSYNI